MFISVLFYLIKLKKKKNENKHIKYKFLGKLTFVIYQYFP